MKTSTEKARNLLNIMQRLGNSNGGMSPAAMRSLYSGAISTISTWGSQLWNGLHINANIPEMMRVEYQENNWGLLWQQP